MTTPCFELRYANDEPVDTGDCIPHYATEEAALGAAPRYRITKDGFGTPTPHRLATPCVPGVVCAVCGIDGNDCVTHFESPKQARQDARDGGWKVNDDGTAVCPDCAPSPDGAWP